MSIDDIPERTLGEIERTAVELARLAGTEIMAALGRTLEVRYKGVPGDAPTFRDRVSEVDAQVEVLIRARLADRFPEHDILGEEMDERPGRNHDFVWAVDPIDGTTNFVNGFPLYAASIGVLHRGRPIVGAIWCSTSHALRTGVYHASVGGVLSFDEEPLKSRANPAVRRRLAGEPEASPDASLPWDIRKTGSAAIECAFVAAGLLSVARFQRPNVWDVAGGIPLVLAAGGAVHAGGEGGWHPLERLEASAGPAGGERDLRYWRRPLILGDAEAVAQMARAQSAAG
jgi:myo-inositol-1(or 4)-monophosphatase